MLGQNPRPSDPNVVMIVLDELALPCGKIRIRPGGILDVSLACKSIARIVALGRVSKFDPTV